MRHNPAAILSAIRRLTVTPSGDRLSDNTRQSLKHACYGLSGDDMIRALHSKLREFVTLDDEFDDVHDVIDSIAACEQECQVFLLSGQPSDIEKRWKSVHVPDAVVALNKYLHDHPTKNLNDVAKGICTERALSNFLKTGRMRRSNFVLLAKRIGFSVD